MLRQIQYSLLLIAGSMLITLKSYTQDYNMLRVYTAKKPIATETEILSSARTVTEIGKTTNYVNGIGQTIQSVGWRQNPSHLDVVQMHSYDDFTGREPKGFLPFVSNVAQSGDITNDGNYKTTASAQLNAFISSLYPGENGASAYTNAVFEASPLGRVLISMPQGNGWVSAGRGVSTVHLSNTAADEVQVWNVAAPYGSLPVNAGTYGAGQLYKTLSTDEAGRQVIEYRDKDSLLILKKSQLTAAADNNSGSNHQGWICTYYAYDDLNNLRFILTPEAVRQLDGSWTLSQSMADHLCYRYEYDIKRRLVIKKSPGAEEQWLVYDQGDRLVLKQDGNQRQLHKWQYYTYDALERPLATGFIVDNANYNNRGYHESNAANSSAYPDLSAYTFQVLSQSYYDSYDWVAGTGLSAALDESNTGNTAYFYAEDNSNFPYPQAIKQATIARGKVTGRKSLILGTNQYLYTVTFYDEKGRTIQTQTTNISNGIDKFTMQYSWSGRLLRILEEQTFNGASVHVHKVLTKMSYDDGGRLLAISKTVNSTVGGSTIATPEKLIAAFTYDEAGHLKGKQLGTNPATAGPLETLSYDYGIRGWVTGINKEYTQAGNNSNYFGIELGYEKSTTSNGTTTFTPQYTGNSSGQIWKSKGDGIARKYDFAYDAADRLSGAGFLQQNGSAWDKTVLDFSVDQLGYDHNSNIKTLQQKGFQQGATTTIDNLTYHYLNNEVSNQLQQVSDDANNEQSAIGDFHYTGTKSVNAIDYSYDPSGNKISDVNKQISSVSYNELNLPGIITVTGKGTISNTYSADGKRLRKVVQENNATVLYEGTSYTTNITTTHTYTGGFVYKSKIYSNSALAAVLNQPEALEYMAHEEGRIRLSGTNGTQGYVFDYFVKDNLGNVRMTLTEEQQQDLYPAATLEPSGVGLEQKYYNILTDNSHIQAASSLPWYANAANSSYPNNNGIPNPPDPTVNPGQTSNYLYHLNGGSGDRFGLGITLKVMAGDQVNIFAKSVWHSNGQTIDNTSYGLSGVLNSFINVFAGGSAVAGATKGAVTGATLNVISDVTVPLTNLLNNTPDPGVQTPKAYINWILFDEQFKPVANGHGFDPVNAVADDIKTHSRLGIEMVKSGYLYVYCSNESNQDVYFDNLQVTHSHGPILEEKHYYPQGLLIAGISSRAFGKMATAFGYQGKEMQNGEFNDGSGLEEYDFAARYYDPQLGRWMTQDPEDQFQSPYAAMGNNWPNGTDPNGKWFGIDDIIVSAVGFVAGYVSYGITQGNWGGKALLTGLAGAAIAEGSYLGLGGGLASANGVAGMGGYGSVAAAKSFAGSYFSSFGMSVFRNHEQLENASGWGALGLLSGYSAVSGISAGFSSEHTATKIDNYLGVKPNEEAFITNAYKGVASRGIGGMLSTAGNEILQHYDPITNKWNLNGGQIFARSLYIGFGGSVFGRITKNTLEEYFYDIYGTSNWPKWAVPAISFAGSTLVQQANSMIWNNNLPRY